MGLLQIIYRDDHLVAIDKPDGLLVHRTRISRDHVFALQLLRDQIGRLVYPVHRLDRPTSGVLVFALSPETAGRLCAEFSSRRVAKRYMAVVRGYAPEAGIVDHPLPDEENGPDRDARTVFRRIAAAEIHVPLPPNPTARVSLVEVEPETGRMHQIRRHFRHASHPVIGDTRHGDGKYNRLFRERYASRRLLLHALSVQFSHPATGATTLISSPLPEDMLRLFGELGWREFAVQPTAPRI
jgi:tRNA pseudouridine65 synthase